MAEVSYTELLPEIMPEVNGCPSLVVRRALRNAVIEFCRESEAWIYRPTALTTISGLPEIDLDLPERTICVKVLSLEYKGNKLEPTSETLLDDRVLDWRAATGKPQMYFKLPDPHVRLVPTPEATTVMSVKASLALAPSRNSTGIDELFLEEHFDALIAGTLNRLMSMREQPWSNPNLAAAHGMQFQEAILKAKRAARGENYAKRRVTRYGGY